MIDGKRIVVVLPAFNAAKTLKKTFNEIPRDVIDEIILTDDCSSDNTIEIAMELEIKNIIIHDRNKGYGANQKSCYKKALELGADIIVMLHPDYQYTPKLIPSMVHLIANDLYKVVIGSRILGSGALKGGMPYYKYVANRILTLIQNILLGEKLSEYHSGYRAYDKSVFQKINFENNSDDFIFDNQVLAQIIYFKFGIAEITCPTKYFDDSSSINFARSMKYGLGVLGVSILFRLAKLGLNTKIFSGNKTAFSTATSLFQHQ